MTRNYLSNLEAIVLAGGKGVRMGSNLPKVLHRINGRPMIFYTLQKLQDLGIKNIIVVVGYKAAGVKKVISEKFNVKFALQKKLLGTAHSLKSALPQITEETKTILVINGDDSAFYSLSTLKELINSHLKNGSLLTVLTLINPQITAVGRIIRDKKGQFLKTLEAKEYLESRYQTDEINCGVYLFEKDWLKTHINKVGPSQKGEYYITDLLNIARKEGLLVNLVRLKNKSEWVGVNTPEELEYANKVMQKMQQK